MVSQRTSINTSTHSNTHRVVNASIVLYSLYIYITVPVFSSLSLFVVSRIFSSELTQAHYTFFYNLWKLNHSITFHLKSFSLVHTKLIQHLSWLFAAYLNLHQLSLISLRFVSISNYVVVVSFMLYKRRVNFISFWFV